MQSSISQKRLHVQFNGYLPLEAMTPEMVQKLLNGAEEGFIIVVADCDESQKEAILALLEMVFGEDVSIEEVTS